MKFFKYFTYNELKDIYLKLEKDHCYFRHPKNDFVKTLGQETVDKLLETGCLKDSPRKTDRFLGCARGCSRVHIWLKFEIPPKTKKSGKGPCGFYRIFILCVRTAGQKIYILLHGVWSKKRNDKNAC